MISSESTCLTPEVLEEGIPLVIVLKSEPKSMVFTDFCKCKYKNECTKKVYEGGRWSQPDVNECEVVDTSKSSCSDITAKYIHGRRKFVSKKACGT